MNLLNFIIKRNEYRIVTVNTVDGKPIFVVEVRGLFMWHIVKSFESDDVDYAWNCAEELLDMLNEEIL